MCSSDLSSKLLKLPFVSGAMLQVFSMDIAFESRTMSGSYSGSQTSCGICDRRWFPGLRRSSSYKNLDRQNRPCRTTAVRNKTFHRCRIEGCLTTNANGRGVQFVTFVLYGFLNCRAKSLIICILWHVAMTTNHFFAGFDSDQPLRLRLIPRDFHPVWTHRFLHLLATSQCVVGYHFGEPCGFGGRK